MCKENGRISCQGIASSVRCHLRSLDMDPSSTTALAAFAAESHSTRP